MHSKQQRAFSLVEVVIALAIAAFALITVLALLPVGVRSASDAVGDTRSSMIAQDVALRLRAIPISSSPSTVLNTNWFYDINGLYLGSTYATAVYRVDAKRGPLNSYPPNTNPSSQDLANTYSSQLEAAAVTIGWPVNTTTGALVPGTSFTNSYTFYLRPVPDL